VSDSKHGAVAVIEEVMKEVSETSAPVHSFFTASDRSFLAELGVVDAANE
jgi:hypothetical protein